MIRFRSRGVWITPSLLLSLAIGICSCEGAAGLTFAAQRVVNCQRKQIDCHEATYPSAASEEASSVPVSETSHSPSRLAGIFLDIAARSVSAKHHALVAASQYLHTKLRGDSGSFSAAFALALLAVAAVALVMCWVTSFSHGDSGSDSNYKAATDVRDPSRSQLGTQQMERQPSWSGQVRSVRPASARDVSGANPPRSAKAASYCC
mmetsp:Transcript_44819/g.106376  ORF Transcript_44819/g.106376 Transcript_44819/m.106376 type:complete len:206 (+) Transcript_44819:167-784(+)